jgi:apolipoprotein N-acyltransferase
VPFTEYFPFRRLLPGIYKLLISYDVTLWEPGSERTVLSFPGFRFATPICFEDIFPDDIRRFVLGGADVILNLSNDYWSLTPVEAQQHFAAAVFRSVENRRPLLCATASGVTAQVDASGRIVGSLPQYVEDYLIADVRVDAGPQTLYSRAGDWFPEACGLAALAYGFAGLAGAASRASRRAAARRRGS